MHRTKVRIVEGVLDANDTIARANRADFDRHAVTVVNLMSAPGAGKTSLLERVVRDLDGVRVGVLEGDVQGSLDADRLAVVRFHGRSPAWGTGSKEDRFRHTYTPGELASWAPRIRAMADRAREVHVLFNNCCGAAAVHAAESMRDLLAAPTAAARARSTPSGAREDPAGPPW